ncbi:AcrR family transcriptional regulator [Arthrobacter pascens]|uniref:TetR/AcrR family transcriptional regulator n=1 Tax=Arthrobacter pascens TaxID=1677 RepID=UPI00278D6FFD|nr:TetR/AcrR family transcriptional regulator [Arthrobacter pascens]MDQ0679760.1 AcrR family transcriptional regulator [Arthrobacter pascens]
MEKPSMPRGRTRSEDSREAILAAAVSIIGADGYAALSIERIARESGTGKQTIYRWWPTKADVVMEALLHKAEMHIPVPDTGSVHDDVREFLAASWRLARMPQVADLLRALAAEAQLDPVFAGRFRDTFIEHRRAALTTILSRHSPPQSVPGIRVSTLVDVVFGVLWYRLLIMPTDFDDALADELANLITTGAN